MKCLFWLVLAAFVAAMFSIARPAAAEIVLKYATLDVPQAHLNVEVHHPWAAKINAEAHGLFKIDVYDGEALANQGNIYNQVVSNVVQIGWGLPVLAGKFPLLEVCDLPYVSSGNSAVDSVALWRLYKSGLLNKEFNQVVPLKLIVFPQSGIQFRRKPKTLDNLDGLKVLALSKIGAEVVEKLGGAPLSLPIDETYEALQRGTADAIEVGWTAFQPFKLAEVTHDHLDVPLGGATGYVFMARKEWNSLPQGVRKILVENSGEGESRAFGVFWNRVEKMGREDTLKEPGHTLLHLTAAQAKTWHDRLAPLADAWAKSIPGGEKVLADYRKFIAEAKAGQ